MRFVRRVAGWALFVALLLVVLAEAAYLLRRPLLLPFVRGTVEKALADAIGGTATIGDIDGSWLTSLSVRDLQLRSDGLLREVQGGALEVRLDPLRLLRGDLGGAVALQLSAGTVALDLDAQSSATGNSTPSPSNSPLDLGALLHALPAGADIAVRQLTVSGHGEERSGGLHVLLQPATGDGARRIAVRGLGLQVRASVRADGIDAELLLADTAAVPRLFAPLPAFAGGATTANVTLRLQPEFALDAALHIDGLAIDGKDVEALAASGHLDGKGLQRLQLDLERKGMLVRVHDAALRFAEPLASLRGDVTVDCSDLHAVAELLPAAVRAQMPIAANLRARAGDGRLSIDRGHFRTAAGELHLLRGAIAIDGSVQTLADAPVVARFALLRPETLPLPELPFRVLGSAGTIEVGSRDGGIAAKADVRLQLADADGHAIDELRLRADGELAGRRLHLRECTVAIADSEPALTLRADVPLDAADGASLLANTAANLTARELPLSTLHALLPSLPGRGAFTGTVAVDRGIAVDLRAVVGNVPTLPTDTDATLQLAGELRDRTLQVRNCELNVPAGRAALAGSVEEIDVAALLRGALDWPSWRPDLRAELDLRSLEHIDLTANGGPQLAGTLRGALRCTGTFAAPVADAQLRLQGIAVRRGDATLVDDLGGTLQFDGTTLAILGLRGRATGREFAIGGDLVAADGSVTVRSLRAVLDAGLGGSIDLEGSVPLPRDGDFTTALADAELHATCTALVPGPGLGRIDGTLTCWPNSPQPLACELQVADLRLGDDPAPHAGELRAALSCDGHTCQFDELRLRLDGLRIDGSGRIDGVPPAWIHAPNELLAAPLTIELRLPQTDLGAMPPALAGLAQWAGLLDATVRLDGSLQQPMPAATLTLARGALTTRDGQRLDDIEARVVVTPDRVQLEDFTGSRGGAPLHASGSLASNGPLWREWQRGELDFAVAGTNVLLHRKAGVKVRADVDVQVRGPLSDFAIAGTVGLRDAKMVTRLPLLDFSRTGGSKATSGIAIPGLELGPGIAGHFDLRITTVEPFAIANNVANGTFDVTLALRGPLALPQLEGTVTGEQVQLILPGMRLRTSTMLVEFRRDDPRHPVVTVTARGRRHGYDVQAVIRGRYDRPQILLSSDPPLPPDDLVVLVTTGARPSALRSTSGVSTVLGAYLAQELADWIFGSESTEAKESFLDRFTIETGTEISQGGTESVVVEFRILDSVYLQGERDVYEDLNMGVVYRLKFR